MVGGGGGWVFELEVEVGVEGNDLLINVFGLISIFIFFSSM